MRARLVLIVIFLVGKSVAQNPKRVAPAKRDVSSSAFTFSYVPFDVGAEKLKPKYLGNNVSDMFLTLSSIEGVLTKSQFETGAAYQERISLRLSNTSLHGFKANDLVAIEIDAKTSYDAESGRFKVLLSQSDDSYMGPDPDTANWTTTTKPGGSYVGSNAFGVKKLIRRVYQTRLNVTYDKPAWLLDSYKRGNEYLNTGGFLFEETGVDAMRLSRTLRILLIGHLKPPFVSHEVSVSDATISDPIELVGTDNNIYLALSGVWLYDILSGEVIRKYGESPLDGSALKDRTSLGTGAPTPAVASLDTSPTRISGGVMDSNLLTKIEPTYPPIAKAAHVGGTVVLHALISKTGVIQSLSAVSGPDMLRGAALDAVRQWKYKPYLLKGEPTAVDTTITVNFNLNEK